MEKKIILLDGYLDLQTSISICGEILTSQEPVHLMINSDGGGIGSGLRLLEILKEVGPFSAEVYRAGSIAAFIMMHAETIEFDPKCLVIFHTGSVSCEATQLDQEGRIPRDSHDRLRGYQELLFLLLREKTTLPGKALDELLNTGKLVLDYNQCLQYNIGKK